MIDLACANNGWRVWPANATVNEKKAAIESFLNGDAYTMYPPGYEEAPIDTSGKLIEKQRESSQG